MGSTSELAWTWTESIDCAVGEQQTGILAKLHSPVGAAVLAGARSVGLRSPLRFLAVGSQMLVRSSAWRCLHRDRALQQELRGLRVRLSSRQV